MDGTDADGEWSDDDGVKSGSVTALSDNEPDDVPKSLKTITTSPGNHKIDPVHAILDKIDAELGAIATANNITTFSQPQSVKKSSFPIFDRNRLETQGVVFDTTDDRRDKQVLGHTRGGSSDRDTGVGTGSVQDDAGSEHKRIMGSAQIYSDVGNLTDVHTDGRRGTQPTAPLEDDHRGDDGHSDLDSLAAQQIDEKFKEIMRKKRGGYLDDLKARIPRPGSDRDTVNSDEGVVTRPTAARYTERHRRSHSTEPRGKPPLPTLPRTCLTPPFSPTRGPADLPPLSNHVSVMSRPPKLKQLMPHPNTGYASDLESVKTEDFESRFQDLMIGQTPKDTSSKFKTLSKKLANRESKTQVQSNTSHSGCNSYPKPTGDSKSFPSARLFSSFQNKPANDLTLRKSPFSSLPASDSRSTTDIIKLPRPRSVSPARLSGAANEGLSSKGKHGGLFSWDDAFWRAKNLSSRPDSSASTFEEVESLCFSKSSSSVDSVHGKNLHLLSEATKPFWRQNSCNSSSTGTSSGHLADKEYSSSGFRSRSESSVGSVINDVESLDPHYQLSDGNYMDRIFQRVLEWNIGETANDSSEFENVSALKTRSASSGLLDLGGTNDRRGRQKVLIIPDEDEGDIPFAKMKFARKTDLQEISGLSSMKEMYPVSPSVKFSPHCEQSGKLDRTLSMSTSSFSTDVSSWQESNKTDGFHRRNTSNFSDSSHNQRQSCGSEDNPSTIPPSQSSDYYPPFNPFLPVNAERILISLGFSGSDSLLPERFLKDWYQKMAKAQKEWSQSRQFSDCQESVEECSLPSRVNSGKTTPNQVCFYPEHFHMKCHSGRSETVSTYPNHEGHEVSKMHSKDQKKFGCIGEFGSSRRRRQWANTRQKSLPLFLETLNEEDESRSRRASIDKFSQFKAFLKEEMASVKSGGSSQDNNIDSDSDSSNSAIIHFSKSVSDIPETGELSSMCLPNVVDPTKSDVDPGEMRVAPQHISHEVLPSTDSLEVADIMQYQQPKPPGPALLEPAMVSIILEDVDGNVTSSMCNSTSLLNVDNLHIPLSRSSSSSTSTSPVPQSPVTVIEVGRLDNQMDSMDTDESTSVSKENDSLQSSKGSFDSDPSKPEAQPDHCKRSSFAFERRMDSNQTHSVAQQPLKDIMEHRDQASASQCRSVEVDDGRLSPIVKFPPVQVLREWFDDIDGTSDYYITQDQSVQCEMEAGTEEDHRDHHCEDVHVLQAEKYTQTDLDQKSSKSLSDKSSQISVQTSSCAVQTFEIMEDEDECQMFYQKVCTNTTTCTNKCAHNNDTDKTVSIVSPLMTLDEMTVPPRDRRHSITDDWVISNFRAQSTCNKNSIALDDDSSERKDETEEENNQCLDVLVESHFTSDSNHGKTCSQYKDPKLNEDGSQMTKLDIFALDFLKEAEERCLQLRLAADLSYSDTKRRHSLLSSTHSNESCGTINTVIYVPRNQRPLLSMSSDPEGGEIIDQNLGHENRNGGEGSPPENVKTDQNNCFSEISSDSLTVGDDGNDDGVSLSVSVQSDSGMDDVSFDPHASGGDGVDSGCLREIGSTDTADKHVGPADDRMDTTDTSIDSCTVAKNLESMPEKKHCESQFRWVGINGFQETEEGDEWNDRCEQVPSESGDGDMPSDNQLVNSYDLLSDGTSSQSGQLCEEERASGCNACETGRDIKAKKTDAKKKFLSQFMINMSAQNVPENEPEFDQPTVEKHHSKQDTSSKCRRGSHFGLSQVKQMTTIYESDNSESESSDHRAVRGNRHPEIIKSRTWNGDQLVHSQQWVCHSLTERTGGKSTEEGFAQMARRAFVSQKAERVTSPCEPSDGETGYVSEPSESQDNTWTGNKQVSQCHSQSDSGVCRTLSNNYMEHTMEQAEMEDSDFKQAEMEDAGFKQAEMEDSDFKQAEMEDSDFKQAEMEDSDFKQAEMEDSHFKQAEMEDSDFKQAEMEDLDLKQAEIWDSDLEQAETWDSVKKQDVWQATSEHTDMYFDQKKETICIPYKTSMFTPSASIENAYNDRPFINKVCVPSPGGLQLNEDNSFIPITSVVSTNPQTMITRSSSRRALFPRQKGSISVKHGNHPISPSSQKVLMGSKIKMHLTASVNSNSASTNSFSPVTPPSSQDETSVEAPSYSSSSSQSPMLSPDLLKYCTKDSIFRSLSPGDLRILNNSSVYVSHRSGDEDHMPFRFGATEQLSDVTGRDCSGASGPEGEETTDSTVEDAVMVDSVGPKHISAWPYSIYGQQMNQSKNMIPESDHGENRMTIRQKSEEFGLKNDCSKSVMTHKRDLLVESCHCRSSCSSVQMSSGSIKESLSENLLPEDTDINFPHCSTYDPAGVSVKTINNKQSFRSQDGEQVQQYQGMSLNQVLCESEAWNSKRIPSFGLSKNTEALYPTLRASLVQSLNHSSTEIQSMRQKGEEEDWHGVEDEPERVLRSIEIRLKPLEGEVQYKKFSSLSDFNHGSKKSLLQDSVVNGTLQGGSYRQQTSEGSETPLTESYRQRMNRIDRTPHTNSNGQYKQWMAEPSLSNFERPNLSGMLGTPQTESERHKPRVARTSQSYFNSLQKSRVNRTSLADISGHNFRLANSDRLYTSQGLRTPDAGELHESNLPLTQTAAPNRIQRSRLVGTSLTDSDRLHTSCFDRLHRSNDSLTQVTESNRINRSRMAGTPLADFDRLHTSHSDGLQRSLAQMTESNRINRSRMPGTPLVDSKSKAAFTQMTDSYRIHKLTLADSDGLQRSRVDGPPVVDSNRITWPVRFQEEVNEVRFGARNGKTFNNRHVKNCHVSTVSDIRSRFESRDIHQSTYQSCMSTPKRPVNSYILKLASMFEAS